MDFDANLFLNYIPVISAITLTIVTCVTIFIRLRNRRPVKVNCWFCNENTKVPRLSVSWWFCPHCEQYNGFSEDGDYNYEIPEQHKIIKSNIKQDSYCQKKEFSANQNSLCKDCNKREEFKLLKLRELEDTTDVYNAKQLSLFEKSFEKKYPLCMKCQNIVQKVLHKQALWLTQYKMLLFKQKPIKRIIQNKEKIERTLRIVLSILASVTICFTEAWYLPLCGIFVQLAACLASPTDKRQSDIIPILGWACLFWVNSFSTTAILEILNIPSINHWKSLNDNDTYQYFIVSLGTAVGLANLRFHSHKTISNGKLTFKKLESPNKSDISLSRSSSPEPVTMPIKETSCNKEPKRNLYSPVNITNTLMSPSAVETPIPLKPTNVPQWTFEENGSSTSNLFSSRTSAFSPDMEDSFPKTYSSQSYSLNDSLTSLNSLSLGNSHKLSTSHSPQVFKTKVYGTTSPDIFTKQLRYNPKRSILAPPKLRSITQTSWVAGGYWQSGMDVPTLSRSSSQSSGFGSSGSNCGPSCEPSVHEFDQCSVVSDRCNFARPETPLSGRNSAIPKRKSNNCSPRCTQRTDMDCNTESLQHVIRSQTQCNGHTTIITNPVWLPALLCGSLLFNMVVLCTILMR